MDCVYDNGIQNMEFPNQPFTGGPGQPTEPASSAHLRAGGAVQNGCLLWACWHLARRCVKSWAMRAQSLSSDPQQSWAMRAQSLSSAPQQSGKKVGPEDKGKSLLGKSDKWKRTPSPLHTPITPPTISIKW